MHSDHADNINANMSHNGVGSDISIEAEESSKACKKDDDNGENSSLNPEIPLLFRGLVSCGEFINEGREEKEVIEEILNHARMLPSKHLQDFVDTDDADESNAENIISSTTSRSNIIPIEYKNLGEDDIELGDVSTVGVAEAKAPVKVHLESMEPFNEYLQNDEILFGCFWFIIGHQYVFFFFFLVDIFFVCLLTFLFYIYFKKNNKMIQEKCGKIQRETVVFGISSIHQLPVE